MTKNSLTVQEVHLRLENTTSHDLKFVLEPWGEVHAFPPGDLIEVAGIGPAPGFFDLDMSDGSMTVCAWLGRTVFLFRDGVEFAKGNAERPHVPLNAYPPTIAPLAAVAAQREDISTASDDVTAALQNALNQALDQQFDRRELEIYLGRAVVEGLELAKERRESS